MLYLKKVQGKGKQAGAAASEDERTLGLRRGNCGFFMKRRTYTPPTISSPRNASNSRQKPSGSTHSFPPFACTHPAPPFQTTPRFTATLHFRTCLSLSCDASAFASSFLVMHTGEPRFAILFTRLGLAFHAKPPLLLGKV